MTRLAAGIALWCLVALVVALVIAPRLADNRHALVDAADTTTSTEWTETLPTLPAGFDPAKLVPPTTVSPRPRAARTSPTTRPAPSVIAVGALQDMIRAGFARFGPDVAEQAVRVAGCESMGDPTGQHLDPTARNGQHAGLFQLSREYHLERAQRLGYRWEQMFEAAPNIAVAADLFGEKGKWSPTWTCAWAA